jgi:DNA repair exonuclease SbcCD ATPase subunit
MDPIAQFDVLQKSWQPQTRGDIDALRVHYAETRQAAVQIGHLADSQRRQLEGFQQELSPLLGFREKWLGGRFGGDRQCAKLAKAIKSHIAKLAGLRHQIQSWLTQLEHDVRDRVLHLVRARDPKFDHACGQQARLARAIDETESLILKLRDTLGSIRSAESAHLRFLYGPAEVSEREAARMNRYAMRAVRSINAALPPFRRRLWTIGIEIAELKTIDASLALGVPERGVAGDHEKSLSVLDELEEDVRRLAIDVEGLARQFRRARARLVACIDQRVEQEWSLPAPVPVTRPLHRAGLSATVEMT